VTTSSAAIVNQGHRRSLDLALELPGSPLEAVMSGEVWDEVYDRLAELIEAHRTTIVFVNTRRMAERVARHLAERVGEESVTAHHGSLSKEHRLDAEERLKGGKLKALVATASLELGIDIGHVDLVAQLGTPRRIATFLQRVGRSGHTVRGIPKGRLFPLTRDELVECTAIIRSVRSGELDRIIIREKPLDVLAQQIVAEASAEDWDEEALYSLFRRAHVYRGLERAEFDQVVQMLAQGFSTQRGRRGALIHHDTVNGRIRGRRGSRLLAITSGGAIPDNADFRVVLEPEHTFIGSVNEDFAVESLQGDIFQLGNMSWRILQVAQGVVRVEDAHGQPPSIPFWLGESPARSNELSAAVAELRRGVEERLGDRVAATQWVASVLKGTQPDAKVCHSERSEESSPLSSVTGGVDSSGATLPRNDNVGEPGSAHEAAALQLVEYLAESKRMLGVLPTQTTIVAERFFDEAGGMQLVIHSPFGSRVNRAWGLALRKRFCRQFNFELQAAATEDALLLSLGPQHSFPLETVFRFLSPETVEDILVQALLDAPMFGTHWRWNANIALAVPRSRAGRKNPPQIQRMQADDLLAAAFPDAAACLENIPGDREIPDHPLVRQTIDDCVHEVMDLDHLITILRRIQAGEIQVVARDLPEPSPLAHEILNAKPYAFLDDAPAEERRTQAVYTRRAFEPSSAGDLGALDPAAIERVRDEAWPEIRDADELHDALLTSGFLTEVEGISGRDGVSWSGYFRELVAAGRADRIELARGQAIWAATERIPEVRGAGGQHSSGGSREDGIRELFQGRLSITGPTTPARLAASLNVSESDADVALAALEGEGVVLRGQFTPSTNGAAPLEWCDRRLLARIHRYTLNRLRAEIEPVSAADFMRFLFAWQRLDPEHRVAGLEGLASVIGQLDGFELPAAAWETDVLSGRLEEYDPMLLDTLCMMGRVAWGRTGGRADGRSGGPIRSTPIALFLREHANEWLADKNGGEYQLSSYAAAVRDVLQQRGASFFHELVALAGLLATQVEQALGELAGLGLVTSDSFAGLRALITPASKRKPLSGARRRHRTAPHGIESAGRWSLLGGRAVGRKGGRSRDQIEEEGQGTAVPPYRRTAGDTELVAKTYLRRYGIVFKRLLARETVAPAWRDLLMVYRRLEARGEIRGGRFVSGMSGEQFALPEAVGQLRSIRRLQGGGRLVSVGAADPLNLTGILTPGERIPGLAANRVLYRDGVPVLAKEAGQVKSLITDEGEPAAELVHALVRKASTPALHRYLGMSGAPAASVPLNRPPKRGRSRRREQATK
jgi:ATP-dependent Lhr-like helicase